MKPVAQAAIEAQMLDRVRDLVLQEEYLKELVRLTNEELRVSVALVHERIHGLQSQLEDMERKIARLYDALETGKMGIDDLAPRIRDHREKRDLLLRAIGEAKQATDFDRTQLVSQEGVFSYLGGISGVLDLAVAGCTSLSPEIVRPVSGTTRCRGVGPLHTAVSTRTNPRCRESS